MKNMLTQFAASHASWSDPTDVATAIIMILVAFVIAVLVLGWLR